MEYNSYDTIITAVSMVVVDALALIYAPEQRLPDFKKFSGETLWINIFPLIVNPMPMRPTQHDAGSDLQ